MTNLTRHIVRDERASVAVEFAFLLPILLLLFIGVVEVTNLLQVDRKVVSAAQTTADLITQRREVSDAQLNDVLRAAELILEPFSAASESVGIAAVRYNPSSGDPELDWTKNKNGGSVPEALIVAQGLGEPGDGVIVVRVTYLYSPIFFDFILGETELEGTAVLRPRRSSFVQGPNS